MSRTILHLDMDAFFASVEQRDRPELRGKPVLIGHDGPRGVVATASYEARVFGCHSAQPMAVALRLCPHAIVVSGQHSRYGAVSKQVREIMESFTPLVEPLSIDEAFLDVTGSLRLFGDGVAIATQLRERIRTELSLTASVGVAPNKFLAKLASDVNKPDGMTVVDPDHIQAFLDPLPVGRMWGVGKVTEEKLTRLGIHTFADLRQQDPERLARRFGVWGERLAKLSRGIDDRNVSAGRGARSISHEQTFGRDLTDADAVRGVILNQVERIGERLRRAELKARTVTVKIRFGDFQTVTRSMTLPSASDTTDTIWTAARDLFDRWATGFRPVRLIGVAASQLDGEADQMELFADETEERGRDIDRAADRIRAQFGHDALTRAATLTRQQRGTE